MQSKAKTHNYKTSLKWIGNLGSGTSGYRDYSRNHVITSVNKQAIEASSDPAFRGDVTRYNPEELLVASLSSCHMLWYLHLCADAGIIVTEYIDEAEGTMIEDDNGGHFTEVVLKPTVSISDATKSHLAQELHHKAHQLCFISNSLNFEVKIESEVK
jgi:organic hydroperoxide reductase OsmC/OhrA